MIQFHKTGFEVDKFVMVASRMFLWLGIYYFCVSGEGTAHAYKSAWFLFVFQSFMLMDSITVT